MANYEIAQLDDIEAVACPCGMSRRAFAELEDKFTTVHMVDISKDARTHYHKKLTEVYIILDGTGSLELDGELIPVKPLTTVLIKPLCRHRAVGKMRIIVACIPGFDPDDEYFD